MDILNYMHRYAICDPEPAKEQRQEDEMKEKVVKARVRKEAYDKLWKEARRAGAPSLSDALRSSLETHTVVSRNELQEIRKLLNVLSVRISQLSEKAKENGYSEYIHMGALCQISEVRNVLDMLSGVMKGAENGPGETE